LFWILSVASALLTVSLFALALLGAVMAVLKFAGMARTLARAAGYISSSVATADTASSSISIIIGRALPLGRGVLSLSLVFLFFIINKIINNTRYIDYIYIVWEK
jgi:hypothetical protein